MRILCSTNCENKIFLCQFKNKENRHPVHLSTSLHVKEDFIRTAECIRSENVIGDTLLIEATDFSYQKDPVILNRIDTFMEWQSGI